MAMSSRDSLPMSEERTPQLPITLTESNGDQTAEKDISSREDGNEMVVPEMHEASADVVGLIRTVEKYGLMFGELQKLCQKLGMDCNVGSDVEETFKKIQELFTEYRQTAESERVQRTQERAYSLQVKERLDASESDRNKYGALVDRQGQQISQQTDLIDKLQKSLRQAQQQMQDMEERFVKELTEEKRNKTNAHKAHLDAESKVAKLEIARKRAESACQQAMAALDQQRILFKKSQQENLVWKQRTAQLAEEKRHAEQKFEKLRKVCVSTHAEETALEALLAEEERREEAENASLEAELADLPTEREMNEIVPVDDDDMPILPDGRSVGPSSLKVTSQWNVSPSKQLRDLSRTLVLPYATRHHTDPISAFHFTPHYQRRVAARENSRNLTSEGSRHARRQLEYDSRDRLLGKGRSAPPQSVVSGPVILGSGFQRMKNRDQQRSTRWSPGSSDLVVHSESTDSATAEDPAIDAFQSSSHYNNSIAQIDSYDYGGSTSISSPPTSDDYDSVHGSTHRFVVHHQRWNPLQWARKGTDNILGGVRSGVSVATKGSVQLSRNVWTWATIAAVTAGNVCLRQSHFADASDFSDLDETESEASVSAECFKG